MIRGFALASLVLIALGCAEQPVAKAPVSTAAQASAPASITRFVVHVDTLAPEKVQEFEAARARFVKALEARGTADHRGLYLRIGASTYWSVVPFSSWADLEVLGDQRRAAQKKMTGIVEEYDRASDESLVFPHKNEIWSERLDLSYLPTNRPLYRAVRVDIEDLRPTADYEAAWKPIAEALAKIRYPLERRTFFSSYGTGRMLSFWLAAPGDTGDAAPLDRALASAVGEARAAELFAALRACVVTTESHAVKVPLEMASPKPAN